MALSTNLISISSLSSKTAPNVLFYFLEAEKESSLVAVGLPQSTGARQGIPYVVLPNAAISEAFLLPV